MPLEGSLELTLFGSLTIVHELMLKSFASKRMLDIAEIIPRNNFKFWSWLNDEYLESIEH